MDLSNPTSFDQDTITVQEPQDPISVVASVTQNLICYGDSSGIITIDSIVGGNDPYDIQWGGIDTNNLFADEH